MQVFPRPVAFANLELELLEALFKRLALSAFAPPRRILCSNFLQILADQARQRGLTFYRNLANLFYQIIIE